MKSKTQDLKTIILLVGILIAILICTIQISSAQQSNRLPTTEKPFV